MPTNPEPLPHRGEKILALGVASLACSICGVFVGFAAIAAVPLGVAAWLMGRKDLIAMQGGEMDPAGIKGTATGRLYGMLGLVLPVLLIGEAIFSDPTLPFM